MTEWSCSGLQLRQRRFDSDSRLHLFPSAFAADTRSPGGGIGRHRRLKISRSQDCAGSSPAPGTNQKHLTLHYYHRNKITLNSDR